MAEAAQFAAWQQTSSLLSMLFNVNRAAKTRARGPAEFNPMLSSGKRRSSSGVPITPKRLKSLAKVFADARGKGVPKG